MRINFIPLFGKTDIFCSKWKVPTGGGLPLTVAAWIAPLLASS